jgi:hypothetical protein
LTSVPLEEAATALAAVEADGLSLSPPLACETTTSSAGLETRERGLEGIAAREARTKDAEEEERDQNHHRRAVQQAETVPG